MDVPQCCNYFYRVRLLLCVVYAMRILLLYGMFLELEKG